MAVKLNTIKCPECGAELPVEKDKKKMFCSYCGAEINISEEKIKVYKHKNQSSSKQHNRKRHHFRHDIDENHLEMMDETAAELSRRDEMLFYVWLIATVTVLMIGMLCASVLGHPFLGKLLVIFLGVPIAIGGAYYLFYVQPGKDKESLLIAGGGIRFPHNSEYYKGQDYRLVVDSLKELGFENFRYENMGDVVIGLLQKPNKIERITIDGKGAVSGRIYFPDSRIKIIYHGKKK